MQPIYKKYIIWSVAVVLLLSASGITWYMFSTNEDQKSPSNTHTTAGNTTEPLSGPVNPVGSGPIVSSPSNTNESTASTSVNNNSTPTTSTNDTAASTSTTTSTTTVSSADKSTNDAAATNEIISTTTTTINTAAIGINDPTSASSTTTNASSGSTSTNPLPTNKNTAPSSAPPPPKPIVKKAAADILKPPQEGNNIQVTGDETVDDLFLKTTDMPVEFVYNAEISSDLEHDLKTLSKFNHFKLLEKMAEIPKKPGPTVGIQNAGNLCYVTVIVQALYRVPVIRKIIANLNVYYRIAEKTGKLNEELLKSFKYLEGINYFFYQLNSDTFEKGKRYCVYYYPSRCRPNLVNEDQKVITASQNKITKAYQSTPHKYFRAFQSLTENYKFKVFGNSPQYLDFILHHIVAILPKPQRSILNIVRKNKIHSHFESDELLNLTKQISTYYQYDLEVVIKNKRGVKLESLIQHFFVDKEFRDNPFLSYFPEFIPIAIRKDPNSKRIFVPEILDLTSYASAKNSSTDGVYRFMNIVLVHENASGKGTGEMNHYIAYIREDDGKYYKYDDATVSVIKQEVFEEKMSNSRALIYFYEKIAEPKQQQH